MNRQSYVLRQRLAKVSKSNGRFRLLNIIFLYIEWSCLTFSGRVRAIEWRIWFDPNQSNENWWEQSVWQSTVIRRRSTGAVRWLFIAALHYWRPTWIWRIQQPPRFVSVSFGSEVVLWKHDQSSFRFRSFFPDSKKSFTKLAGTSCASSCSFRVLARVVSYLSASQVMPKPQDPSTRLI